MIFTVDELVYIIKHCRDNGVAHLRFGDLFVEFGRPTEPPVEHKLPEPHYIPAPTMAETDHQKQNEESLDAEEVRMREEQVSELLITDPERAEEMLANGELTEDGKSGSDETP